MKLNDITKSGKYSKPKHTISKKEGSEHTLDPTFDKSKRVCTLPFKHEDDFLIICAMADKRETLGFLKISVYEALSNANEGKSNLFKLIAPEIKHGVQVFQPGLMKICFKKVDGFLKCEEGK
jgi:hypothetical protein